MKKINLPGVELTGVELTGVEARTSSFVAFATGMISPVIKLTSLLNNRLVTFFLIVPHVGCCMAVERVSACFGCMAVERSKKHNILQLVQ